MLRRLFNDSLMQYMDNANPDRTAEFAVSGIQDMFGKTSSTAGVSKETY